MQNSLRIPNNFNIWTQNYLRIPHVDGGTENVNIWTRNYLRIPHVEGGTENVNTWTRNYLRGVVVAVVAGWRCGVLGGRKE